MRARIVYTTLAGGVAICCPSRECVDVMHAGGWWDQYPERTVRDQVRRMVDAGHARYAAQRYFDAMGDGGLNEREAIEVIRDRDCGHLGTGLEIWDVADVPADRWFRDAWVRSHNGGPIGVSLPKARPIQFQRIVANVDRENRKRKREIELFDKPITIDLASIRSSIKRADTLENLRRIWPEELAHG